MTAVRRCMFGLAVVQALSTLLGFVQLLFFPQLCAEALAGTPFAGRHVLAGVPSASSPAGSSGRRSGCTGGVRSGWGWGTRWRAW